MSQDSAVSVGCKRKISHYFFSHYTVTSFMLSLRWVTHINIDPRLAARTAHREFVDAGDVEEVRKPHRLQPEVSDKEPDSVPDSGSARTPIDNVHTL